MDSPCFLLADALSKPASGVSGWLTDPKHTVLIVLLLAILIGGGRKWLEARRASRLKARLLDQSPASDDILAAADHGRAALPELFALLDPSVAPPARLAAARALARLWAADQLIAEEERALVVRAFEVLWHARRRYPRALDLPIPISVRFGLAFLDDDPGISSSNLEWSTRLAGSARASQETFTDWQPAQSERTFLIDPSDFPGPGPHRLVFQSRTRTRNLTSSWELDLPHVPFSVEFDPLLEIPALLALPDETRAGQVSESVRLVPSETPEDHFLPIHPDLAIRNPPALRVAPRALDLAHRLALEIEGVDTPIPAGSVVALASPESDSEPRRFPLQVEQILPAQAISRPGESRLRARLTPDPRLGWADPDVRSLWPGEVLTDWVPVQLIRR